MGLRRREHVTRETTLDTPRPATALFTIDDDWWVATLASVSDAFTGVTMDSTPPVRACTPIWKRCSGIRLPRRFFTTLGTTHSAQRADCQTAHMGCVSQWRCSCLSCVQRYYKISRSFASTWEDLSTSKRF